MSQNPKLPNVFGRFLALLGAGCLLSAGTNVHAQPYPTIPTGTYNAYEAGIISSAISGTVQNTTNTASFSVAVTQSSNTLTLTSQSLPGQLVATLSGNAVTSLTGPAIKMTNGFTATTNYISSASGWVSNDQIYIKFSGTATGTYVGGSIFQSSIQGGIQIFGAFVPLQAPTITTQPVGVTNTLGLPASFSITATGATPLTYQWYKNNAAIANATNSTYTIDAIQATDAGTYKALVSNLIGTTNSTSATLKINYPPSITTQPAKLLKVALGAKTTLTVKVKGTGATSYQWRFNGIDIAGATNASYTLTAIPTPDSGTNLVYNVFVSNTFGSILSSNSVVTVIPDTTLPKVTITSPTANARSTNLVFSGTATDNGQVTAVTYWITNINNGVTAGSPANAATLVGTNPASLKWTATPDVSAGSNILAVVSTDLQGNKSVIASQRFFYQVPTALTLTKGGTGNGTVVGKTTIAGSQPLPVVGTTNLYIGQPYSVTATPDTKSFFTNWTTPDGPVTNTTLNFIMAPGLTLQANFVTNLFLGMAGTYNGLYTNATQTDLDSSGALLNFTVDSQGRYSGQLFANGVKNAVTGKFDMSGHARNTINRAAAAGGPLVVDLTLAWNDTPRRLYGTVSAAGKWTSQLTADLGSTTLASAQYTMILPPATADAQHPAGYGYLLVTNRAGTVTVSGTLGDGTAISQTVPLSQDGRFPLFITAYKGAGAISGWVSLTNGSPVADLIWIKKAAAGLYPQGFTNTVSVLGSPWVKPASALPYTIGDLNISGGDFTNAVTYQFTVQTNNTVVCVMTPPPSKTNPAPFTGTIDPKTGLVKLTLLNGKAKVSATGAILQNESAAYGVFTGRTSAGSITMQEHKIRL